jgi:putative ABC transport system permease protein
MFQNYFKIALRNLVNHKTYSLINILGLAIGITCCLLIMLYVRQEFSYDSFNENADRVFRIIMENNRSTGTDYYAQTPYPVGPAFREEYPEVEYPFQYSFLDEDINKLYVEEERTEKIIGTFSAIAIFIACLGLFGLAAYTAEQRTKEIGVRKALGASVANIILLLSKEFIRLVLIASIIAIPIAYYAMNHWLTEFAYRISLAPGIFISAFILAFLISLLTVGYQSIKAALANPVESLRYE